MCDFFFSVGTKKKGCDTLVVEAKEEKIAPQLLKGSRYDHISLFYRRKQSDNYTPNHTTKFNERHKWIIFYMAIFFYTCPDPCPKRQLRFVRATGFFCTVPLRKDFPSNLFSLIRARPYKNVRCPCKTQLSFWARIGAGTKYKHSLFRPRLK